MRRKTFPEAGLKGQFVSNFVLLLRPEFTIEGSEKTQVGTAEEKTLSFIYD